MKTNLFLAILLMLCIDGLNAADLKSIKEFRVKPKNYLAVIQAVACVDKNEDLFNAVFPQK